MRRYAIFQLDALDLDDFHQQFGVSFSEVFPQAYANLLELGLAQIHQSKLVLTEKGTMFRDVIAQTFYSEEVGRLERSYYHA